MEAELKEVERHIGWRQEMQEIDVLVPIFEALRRHRQDSSRVKFHLCLSPQDIMANVAGFNYHPSIHLPPRVYVPSLESSGYATFKVAQDSEFAEFIDQAVTKKWENFLEAMLKPQ